MATPEREKQQKKTCKTKPEEKEQPRKTRKRKPEEKNQQKKTCETKPEERKQQKKTRERKPEKKKQQKKTCKITPKCKCLLVVIALAVLGGLIAVAVVFILKSIAACEIVSSPKVFKGPTSVKSFCILRVIDQPSGKLAASAQPITQQGSINTREKCRRACLGPNSDGRLPSGETCQGGDFDDSRNICRLTTSLLTVDKSSSQAGYFRIEHRCYPAMAPGDELRFYKWHNRRPTPNNGASGSLTNASSALACLDHFVVDNGIQRAGTGFIFNEDEQSCTFYASLGSGTELVIAEGTQYFYLRDSSPASCYDLYPSRTQDKSEADSIYQVGPFKSVFDCQHLCNRYLQNHSRVCYGFDYKSSDKACLISTKSIPKLAFRAYTVNYRREFTCYGCVDGTRYISTINTIPLEGYLHTMYNDITSPRVCASLCQGNVINFKSKSCYGFTFNRNNKSCILYQDYRYHLDAIGGSPGVDHYRRLFQCAYSNCNESYTKTCNVSSTGGIKQPKDINTLARCNDRCLGYVIGTKTTCYGLDFNRKTNECHIYIQANYKLQSSETVDNYRRNMKCHLPY